MDGETLRSHNIFPLFIFSFPLLFFSFVHALLVLVDLLLLQLQFGVSVPVSITDVYGVSLSHVHNL